MTTLAEFQERNCEGCFYADPEKVGTGRACCTYPQPIKLENGKCITRKEASYDSNRCSIGSH